MIVTDLINDTLRPKGRFEQKRVMTLSSFLSALMYGFMPLFKNGFEVKEFVFLGFLPKKDGERLKVLEKYKEFDGAKIVYESPFRVKKLEEQIKKVYGENIQIAITREMTKKFEEVLPTVSKELKGEMTVIFY